MNDTSRAKTTLYYVIICTLAALLSVFLGNAVVDSNVQEIAVIIGAIAVFFFARLIKGEYVIYASALVFLAGSIGVLGGASPFMLVSAIGLGNALLAHITKRVGEIVTGYQPDFLFICGFMAVMAYHAVHDRLGLKILGSTIWGGRFYIYVLISLMMYFAIISSKLEREKWSKLINLIIYVYLFDLAIGLLTTAMPSLVEVISSYYSGVSLSTYEDAANGFVAEEVTRYGAMGNFGFAILLIIGAKYNIKSLLQHPLISFLGLISLGGILMSGYRSAVVNAILLLLAICIRDLKGKTLLLIPLLSLIVLLLPLVNTISPLPKQAQRTLAFLPGNWDVDMLDSASGSNEFRYTVWNTWYQKFFLDHWAFGRGFGFNSEWAGIDPTRVATGGYSVDWAEAFIETGSIHNGLISSVDCLGVFGGFFFIAWNIVYLKRVIRYLWRTSYKNENNTTLRYFSLYVFVSTISYWYGALNIGAYLATQFIAVGVFNYLYSEEIKSS